MILGKAAKTLGTVAAIPGNDPMILGKAAKILGSEMKILGSEVKSLQTAATNNVISNKAPHRSKASDPLAGVASLRLLHGNDVGADRRVD